MERVRIALDHLDTTFSDFVVPSATLKDIPTLKQQIELRRRALRELQLIRFRLRPLMQLRYERLATNRAQLEEAVQVYPSCSQGRPRRDRRHGGRLRTTL